ncbi:MAG: PAS domain S-box protein [Verrucomicrobiota bacterium]
MTDRVARVERAMRASELSYRRLFESAMDGILILDADTGRINDVNPFLINLLGFSKSEMTGKTVGELSPFRDIESNQAMLEKLQQHGYVRYEDLPLETKDGRKIAVEFVSNVYQAGDCKVIQCNVRDITRRKWSNETLRISEENFRNIFANAPVGIFQSTNNRLVVANPAMARMFGYADPAEMIASTVSPEAFFVRPDQRRKMVREVMESNAYVEQELEERRKDGSIFSTEVHMRAVRDEAGQTKFLEGFIKDITARKHAEGELLKMSQALEQCPVTIVITDLVGNIEYVNPAFTKASGYTKEEVLGKNSRILKSGKTALEDYQRLWETITTGREWRGEFLNKARDGRLFCESAVISPIVNKAGRITHFLAVKEDITQRKQLEEQLRQAQKMEAVGQLAGGVAHDFNNILVATLMHLGLLQNNPNLSPKTKESLLQVEKETVRAANLTRQLLMFSRQQAARIGPLELNALITNMVKMLQRLLGENIEIINHLSSEAIWLSADEGMMEQVVMNLCVNARDAMAKGGRLTIATTVVQITEQPVDPHPDARPGRFACLSVSDTGSGMDETVLSRIFEPFFTTKAAGKGTGLGLATVYGIIQQHQGWVEVESKVGQGSSFRVCLPVAKPLCARAISSVAEDIRGGSETILVVEDEVQVRRLVALTLRKLGYAVLEAGDGLEALKVWEQHHEKIALLFTDTLLPGNMTGLELAVRFKKEKASLKIISSSGYSPDLANCPLAAGKEITYLPKPYASAVLAKTVRRCLDNP